jgi:hypothetical protein
MPTTPGNAVQTVADIIQVLTKCTKKQADDAETELCKSPRSVATLAMACGLSTTAIAMGGRIAVAGIASGGTVSLGGVLLGGAGLVGATKFCGSFVKQGVGSVNQALP